jgi:transcription initiation factor TFIID TATA-box-binding protein
MFIKHTIQKRPRHTAFLPACPATPLSVVNLTATASFNTQLPIDQLVMSMGGACKKRGFNDWVIRLEKPRVTIQVFRKGTANVIGAKRGDEALWALHQTASRIRDCADIETTMTNFRIRNMVLSQTLGYKLDLERVESGCGLYCVYNPEIFPGIHITQRNNGRHTVIAFQSGKIIVTGAVDHTHAHAAINEINFSQYEQPVG